MTNEQAIKIMKEEKSWESDDRKIDAFNMAIEALEKRVTTSRATQETIKFILNGCDISFVAEAPGNITLEQLLKQCDKIKPDWCACGICSTDNNVEAEIIIDYDNIKKANEHVSCEIID